jgi:hypothetical protein
VPISRPRNQSTFGNLWTKYFKEILNWCGILEIIFTGPVGFFGKIAVNGLDLFFAHDGIQSAFPMSNIH